MFNLVSNREAIDEVDLVFLIYQETLEGLRDVSEYANSLIHKGKLQMDEEDVGAALSFVVLGTLSETTLQHV